MRKLTQGGGYNGSPAFSPDGTTVAYYRGTDTGATLMVVGVDGSGARAIVEGGWNWNPKWSPDGRSLVYTAAVSEDQKDLDLMVVGITDGDQAFRLIGGPGRELDGVWVKPWSQINLK